MKVEFRWPDPVVARAAATETLQAFDVQRSALVRAQAEAAVAGIEKTMVDNRARDHLADLVNQRTETVVTEHLDLPAYPTVDAATQPSALWRLGPGTPSSN